MLTISPLRGPFLPQRYSALRLGMRGASRLSICMLEVVRDWMKTFFWKCVDPLILMSARLEVVL